MLSLICLILAFEFATAFVDLYGWKVEVWPDNTIYYSLPQQKDLFKRFEYLDFDKVFKHIEENTCINVKERKGEAAYVQVDRDHQEPRTDMGYTGQKEHKLWIKLDEGDQKYATYDTIMHEFMHVLGLPHESFIWPEVGKEQKKWDFWATGYESLRKLYNCKGTYPRKSNRKVECVDQDNYCSIDPAARCAEYYWKDHCDKSCNKCDGQQGSPSSGASPPKVPDRPACFDKAADCVPRPDYPLDYMCNDPSSWHKNMCDKTCKKC